MNDDQFACSLANFRRRPLVVVSRARMPALASRAADDGQDRLQEDPRRLPRATGPVSDHRGPRHAVPDDRRPGRPQHIARLRRGGRGALPGGAQVVDLVVASESHEVDVGNDGDAMAEQNRSWHLACWVHAHRMIDLYGSQDQRLRQGSRLPFESSARRRDPAVGRRDRANSSHELSRVDRFPVPAGDGWRRARCGGRRGLRRFVRRAPSCRSRRSQRPTRASPRHHRGVPEPYRRLDGPPIIVRWRRSPRRARHGRPRCSLRVPPSPGSTDAELVNRIDA